MCACCGAGLYIPPIHRNTTVLATTLRGRSTTARLPIQKLKSSPVHRSSFGPQLALLPPPRPPLSFSSSSPPGSIAPCRALCRAAPPKLIGLSMVSGGYHFVCVAWSGHRGKSVPGTRRNVPEPSCQPGGDQMCAYWWKYIFALSPFQRRTRCVGTQN